MSVPRPERGACHEPAPRPALEIAAIFRAHGDAYRDAHALTREQRAVMRAIERCRTEALGGHLDVCTHCRYERPAYNSCLMGSVSFWGVQPVKGRCSGC